MFLKDGLWQIEEFIPSSHGLCRLLAQGPTPDKAKEHMRELIAQAKKDGTGTPAVILERDGQRFYDEPIYNLLMPTPMAAAVSGIKPIHTVERYVRKRLQWMKPDGKGGLIPR